MLEGAYDYFVDLENPQRTVAWDTRFESQNYSTLALQSSGNHKHTMNRFSKNSLPEPALNPFKHPAKSKITESTSLKGDTCNGNYFMRKTIRRRNESLYRLSYLSDHKNLNPSVTENRERSTLSSFDKCNVSVLNSVLR